MKLLLENQGPQLSPGDIGSFEDEYGCKIPQCYQEFLRAQNGGNTPRTTFLCEGEEVRFIGFYQLVTDTDVGLRRVISEVQEISAGIYFPIGWDIGSDHVCVGPNDSIFVLRGTGNFDFAVGEDAIRPRLIANNLREFVEGLRQEPSAPDVLDEYEHLAAEGTAQDTVLFLATRGRKSVSKNRLTLIEEAAKFDNLAVFEACLRAGCTEGRSREVAEINDSEKILAWFESRDR